MTHTTDFVNLVISNDDEDLFAILYRNVILNKKEILKFLTSFIEDETDRKLLKNLVEQNNYRQDVYVDNSYDISRALF
jgi:hypothetical protein